jgi:hypothetical protein
MLNLPVSGVSPNRARIVNKEFKSLAPSSGLGSRGKVMNGQIHITFSQFFISEGDEILYRALHTQERLKLSCWHSACRSLAPAQERCTSVRDYSGTQRWLNLQRCDTPSVHQY